MGSRMDMNEMRKLGSPSFDSEGNIVALHRKLKHGDQVTWLGRKHGFGPNDEHFQVGHVYTVCFIYPSNNDVELQGGDPGITARAGENEYRVPNQVG